VPVDVLVEAWLLALWYLELLILSVLQYSGPYWNRIAGTNMVQPSDDRVPWAI
jgi:hypothetical protein